MENNDSILQDGITKDYLADDPSLQVQYQLASQNQRLLNFIIDNLLMNYGLSYVSGMAVGAIIGAISEDFLYELVTRQNEAGYYLLLILISYLNYVFYYTFCEKLFKGYTLGKLITGTRAIREDGDELTFKNTLLRSFSRIVPFEVFSGFNIKPWHDAWTKTVVIKVRK